MTDVHTPNGAPPADGAAPKRSLVLSGGGLRVSYQAGVMRALDEAGLHFDHVDGTSGGAINLAMLLSGLSPAEMCDRWRTLRLRDSISPMPLAAYLKAADLVALGDADGIANRVYPHLGIDVERIRAARGTAGTFNLYNFTAKANEVIPHEKIDLDALVAGISLPGLLPPVSRGGDLYLDSAFVRDANPMEAVRRGAEELWIVWCLGDTPDYRGGPVRLYVQVLEMAANAALHEDFDRIREINERIRDGEHVYGHTKPIRLHFIRPRYPLPLDTDLYLGRIDNATLIDMGYADARRYLATMDDDGLPFEPEVTQMEQAQPGVTFRETMEGAFSLGVTDPREGASDGDAADTRLTMHATINIRDIDRFIDDPEHAGEIVGRVDFTLFGDDIPAKSGIFNLFSPSEAPDMKLMVYELAFDWEGEAYYLAGRKEVHNDPGFDLWTDTTTLFTRLHKGNDACGEVVGAGVLTLGTDDLVRMIPTIRVTNGGSAAEQAATLAKFGRFFMGEIWDRYAPAASWWRRLLRLLRLR